MKPIKLKPEKQLNTITIDPARAFPIAGGGRLFIRNLTDAHGVEISVLPPNFGPGVVFTLTKEVAKQLKAYL